MCKQNQLYIRSRVNRLALLLIIFISIDISSGQNQINLPNGGRYPQWSPEGTKIAFLSSTPHQPKSLWTMSSKGSEISQITGDNVSQFIWSRDGKKIYYQVMNNGNYLWKESLVTQTENGESASLLPENAERPEFSRDGKWLAYLLKNGDKRDIWIISLESKQRKQITSDYWVRNLKWIDQDNKIIYQVGLTQSSNIIAIDIKSGEKKMLFHSFGGELSVSPNGKRIAFPVSEGSGNHKLVIMDVDGQNKREFILPGNKGEPVLWSPDGKKLLYPGAISKFQSIWTINSEGSQANQITKKEMQAYTPQWSPDGKLVLFSGKSDKSYGVDLFLMKPDGTGLRRLTQSDYSQWAPSISPDGLKIAFFTNQSKEVEIQISSRNGKSVTRIPNVQIDYNSRLLWSKDGGKIILTTNNRLEIIDIAVPQNKKYIQFPSGFLSADMNYRNGQLVVNAIKSRRPQIFTGDIDSQVVKNLTEMRIKENPKEPETIVDLLPKWTVKNNQIVFTRDGDLWVMNSDGKETRKIYELSSKKDEPDNHRVINYITVSPRGDLILFILANREKNNLYKESWIVDLDGSNLTLIYKEPVLSEFSFYDKDYTHPPKFSPDGEFIYFTSDMDGTPNIRSVPITGGKSIKLTTDGALFPSIFPDEDVLIFTSLSGNKERIYTLPLNGQKNASIFAK